MSEIIDPIEESKFGYFPNLKVGENDEYVKV